MKKISVFLTLLLGVFLISGFAFDKKPVNNTEGKPSLVPDEIVVCFAPSTTEDDQNAIADNFKMKLKKKSKKSGKFHVYKHDNPVSILENLKKEKGVVYAEQNAYGYAFFVPNDPYYSPYQWHMTKIGMEAAWDLSSGSSGVVVAVIDTGVKQSLADLADTHFVAGYDFVNSDNDPTDDEGHGSHVAGTIAQSTNNGVGVTGIAYNASLMPVKVLDASGSGSYTDIADGIYWATDNGADIINMSLGGSTTLTILQDAVNYAWNNGVVIVCAAGNSNKSTPFYPAAYTVCISVSATTYSDTKASYSNYGSTIDISAPGGDSGDANGDGYDDMILQNTFGTSGDGYYFYSGTSMASPHVAGVAALVKSVNSALTNTQIRSILESTALDIGTSGWDQYFGYGRVDAYVAVLEASGGSTNTPPVANFTYTVSGLQVTFTDQSTDSDGTVVSWSWSFGDGQTSTLKNPVHAYAAAGTYTVSLIATDDDGATDSISKSVTVTSGGSIVLTVTKTKIRNKYYANLSWTGAVGTNVNVYRNGILRTTTANDGAYQDGPLTKGTYTYQIKETDGSISSNIVTIKI